MAPPQDQIELCSRRRRLGELPACLWIRQNHTFRQAVNGAHGVTRPTTKANADRF